LGKWEIQTKILKTKHNNYNNILHNNKKIKLIFNKSGKTKQKFGEIQTKNEIQA
jgi:hypothetical protein